MASEADARAEAQLHPDATPDAHPDSQTDNPKDAAQKAPVKRSWRRKYRKMRIRFDDTMNTSNHLILEEYRAQALARRLQEQNDQILDILLYMNDSARLPAVSRVDLREQRDIDAKPTIEDPEVVQQRLHQLRAELADGSITTEDYTQRAEELHNSQTIQLSRSLAGLEAKVPHTREAPSPPLDGLDLTENAPGYMSPTHEEEYLLAMDLACENATDGRAVRVPSTHPPPTEKELTVRNPDSVYNWLRKHQPQVFLQDKDPQQPENVSEKSAAPRANAGGRGKRQSAAAGTPGPKTDHDEDDTFVPESGAGAKSRKSKGGGEDDGAYRPKGGSSRAPKRKREEGELPVKGSKRKRASAVGA